MMHLGNGDMENGPCGSGRRNVFYC